MDSDLNSKLYIYSILYIIFHFSLYVIWLRKYTSFCQERVIFLYHLWSGIIFSLVIFSLFFVYEKQSLSTSFGLIALHGIYSMSFLEIWSLAQGSYSIGMLAGIKNRGKLPQSEIVDIFTEVGERKKLDRLNGLTKLNLITSSKENNIYCLTKKGRIFASLLVFFQWAPNSKNVG